MSYTLWLASPNYMMLFGVHPLQQTVTNLQHEIFETLNDSSSGVNILIHGPSNKGLPLSTIDRACFIINSAYEKNRNVVKRRRSFDIFVKREDVINFVKLFLQTVFGKCYVSGDRIYLQSAHTWELRTKFLAVLANNHQRQQCLDVLIDVAIACYIAALTNINIYTGLKNTATSITETAATNTATIGIESAAQVVGNAVAGAAISAIVDVAISSAMIYVAKKQKDDGRISEKEFSIRIKKTVCVSSCKFVGGTTGSILGQALIPVPIVGAFVGGFCGSLIGAGIGKGITYGVFDRKGKKSSVSTAEQKEKVQTIRKVYGRRIRGHIPKIVIYNEKLKEFQEKTFPKTIKNYLTPPADLQQNVLSGTQLKVNEAMTVTPYINRWKCKKTSPSNSNKPEKTTAAEKQLLVLSKWKTRSKSPESRPTTDLTPISKTDTAQTLTKSTLDTPQTLSKVTQASRSLDNPNELSLAAPTPHSSFDGTVDANLARRASYKDRLSPNQLCHHMKSNVIRTKSLNDKDDSKPGAERISKPIDHFPSSLNVDDPLQTNSSEIPGLFHRLSFKALKDSFLNISTSPSNPSSRENLTEQDADINEDVNEEDSKSSLSRLRSFHSSIRVRNREKMKLSNIQKMTLFNSSVDAEGNVYNSKTHDQHSSHDHNEMDEGTEKSKTITNEEKGEFLTNFTNKLLFFTSPNKRKSKQLDEDTMTETTKTVCDDDDKSTDKPSVETRNNNQPGILDENTNTQASGTLSKPSSFSSSLSNSLSENSSATSSPCTSSGNEAPGVSFSEREFDWWNRKLRHRFEGCNVDEVRQDSVEENQTSEGQIISKENTETNCSGDKTPTSTPKKDRKLFSTLKSLARKVR